MSSNRECTHPECKKEVFWASLCYEHFFERARELGRGVEEGTQ